MLAKLTRGNQVTIPKPIVKQAGLRERDEYLDVAYVKDTICLKPVTIHERFTQEELDALERLFAEPSNRGRRFTSGRAALKHLKRRTKHS